MGLVHTVFHYTADEGRFSLEKNTSNKVESYSFFNEIKFDIGYSIDFKYNRFSDEITEFYYNEDYVSEEIFERFKGMLSDGISGYHAMINFFKSELIRFGYSYYKDEVELSKC